MSLIYDNDIHPNTRIDTKMNWNKNNPVLLKNQIGFESDTQNFKLGDGINNWNSLHYASSYYTSYKTIAPIIKNIPEKDITYITNHGGYIERGNVVNLYFNIVADINISNSNPSDTLSISLDIAPNMYYKNLLLGNVEIFGLSERGYDVIKTEFIPGSNIIELKGISRTHDLKDDYTGLQDDSIEPLLISDLESGVIRITGTIMYITLESDMHTTSELYKPVNDTFKINEDKSIFVITEYEDYTYLMFNLEVYSTDLNRNYPEDIIYLTLPNYMKLPKYPRDYLGANLLCKGINANEVGIIPVGYNDDLDYQLKFISGLRTMDIQDLLYSDMIERNFRFSGIISYKHDI